MGNVGLMICPPEEADTPPRAQVIPADNRVIPVQMEQSSSGPEHISRRHVRQESWLGQTMYDSFDDILAGSPFTRFILPSSGSSISPRAMKKNVSNSAVKVMCPICCTEKPMCFVHTTHECQHTICKSCLATWFENLINNGEFILRCPFTECKRPLSRSELENILSSELLEKIDRFEELSGKNKRECPFCGYIQVGNPDKPMMICDSCGKEHCFVHSAAHNSTMTCAEYEKKHKSEFTKNLEAAMADNAMACPGCQIIVSKTEGCNHMTCEYCKVEFCYLCGVDITGKVDEHFRRGVCNQFDSFENFMYNDYPLWDDFAAYPGIHRNYSRFTKVCRFISSVYIYSVMAPILLGFSFVSIWIYIFLGCIFREFPPLWIPFLAVWYQLSFLIPVVLIALAVGLPVFLVSAVLVLIVSTFLCRADGYRNVFYFAKTCAAFALAFVWFTWQIPLYIFLVCAYGVAKYSYPSALPSRFGDLLGLPLNEALGLFPGGPFDDF